MCLSTKEYNALMIAIQDKEEMLNRQVLWAKARDRETEAGDALKLLKKAKFKLIQMNNCD